MFCEITFNLQNQLKFQVIENHVKIFIVSQLVNYFETCRMSSLCDVETKEDIYIKGRLLEKAFHKKE